MNKICVLGGGSAGWMTALFLRKKFSDCQITLIESSTIGILGAGEGTTPNIFTFLDSIGIPVSDIIKHCNGTIKNGIKFTGWNNTGNSYFHPFADIGNFDISVMNPPGNLAKTSLAHAFYISKEYSLDDLSLSSIASNNNLVRYSVSTKLLNKSSNSILHFDRYGDHALHFDARLLAAHLKKVAKARGVKHIEEDVKDVLLKDGYVSELLLENGSKIQTNFLFDCSGFSRKVIGNKFNAEYQSYSDRLPVNRAVPFFIETNELPPFTEAIAMEYGWVWKIPVQGRFGCGYVFDNSYIDEDAAIEEIKNKFGTNIDIRKAFKFNAGSYKTPWIKNCVALGLSSGFMEPLEATSLMVLIQSLQKFYDNSAGMFYRDQNFIDDYNSFVSDLNEEVVDFIQAHYLCDRTTSKFWVDFKNKNNISSYLQKVITGTKNKPLDFTKGNLFNVINWYSILNGTNQLNKEVFTKYYNSICRDENKHYFETTYNMYTKNLDLAINILIKHEDFIEYLINN